MGRVHRPRPEQYNPPLTWRAQAWRIGLVLLISGVFWLPAVPLQWRETRFLFWVDLSLGVLSLVLSFFRRRWPFTVALLTNAFGALSISATGSHILAAVSLATRRVFWQITLVGVLGLAASVIVPTIHPNPFALPWAINVALGAASMVAMLASGMYIGSRRELLWTLRDRADRAEAEQSLRVEQGQLSERSRIAREMHDVLAHRISLVAMHAGALAYRTDLTAGQMRDSAELIQTTSHQALRDLRQVLGVLRGGTAGGVPESPQPTFADLSSLVLEAEGTGMRIQYEERVVDRERMPDEMGRAAYRIVQEGLTNVRKHAPGVTALVQITGSPADGIRIRIRNPARTDPVQGGGRTPGAGLGLVGLVERAKLAGGEVGTRRDGGSFELSGWLPWPS